MNDIIIFGSSEIADLAYFYFKNDTEFNVVAFTVDDEYLKEDKLNGIPIIPFSETSMHFPPNYFKMHVALSYSKMNKLRHEKYDQAKKSGYQLISYLSSKSVYWPDLIIGDNCFILENQTIQPNVTIGNNVMIWSGNHIGHGTVIKDHVYISSHVVIAGHCEIGRRSFLGINSTIKDFTKIDDDCFVTMNANVVRNISKGSVITGPPSKIFKNDEKQAILIKKKYFKF